MKDLWPVFVLLFAFLIGAALFVLAINSHQLWVQQLLSVAISIAGVLMLLWQVLGIRNGLKRRRR